MTSSLSLIFQVRTQQGGNALQKAVSPISPRHHQLARDSSEMWAAITRNSSSPQCQHFPLGALTNLWALEGGGGCGGKDGVPRVGLLQFNKCHCGALCQLHKQAAISAQCIFCPFTVLDAWRPFLCNPLFMQGRSTDVFSAPLCFTFTLSHSHIKAAQSTTVWNQ